MKYTIFMVFVILLAVSTIAFGESTPSGLQLALEGETLSADQGQAIQVDDRTYLSLSFFSASLHAVTQWDAEAGNATLRLGTLMVKMTENKPTVVWDSTSKAFSYGPIVINGELWVPLEIAKALGVQSRRNGDKLELNWEQNYFLFVKSSTVQGRSAVIFQTTRPVKTKSYLLSSPARLVVDLEGVRRYPYLEEGWSPSDAVEKIRINQFREDVFRMVFDLRQLSGYRIVMPEKNKNQVIVVFDSLVEGIRVEPNDGDPCVEIDTTAQVQYTTEVMTNPLRLVLDIQDATLAKPIEMIPGDGQWISRVRVSQFKEHVVRIVMDLLKPNTCFVGYDRKNPGRIVIRTQQEIRRVEWIQDAGGGGLRIESTGEIHETLIRSKNPERLTIKLRYAKLTGVPSEIPSVPPSIQAIRTKQAGSNEAEVELTFPSYQGYETTFSPDRRVMTVRMKKSPIQGKMIVLDPGHGGADAGAMGSQGVREKEVNLEVSLRLKEMLEEAGARVVMTRMDDRYYSLYERAAIANQSGAALFISVHTNFHPNPNVTGVEIFHYPDRVESNRLGRLLLEEMTKASGLKALAVKSNKDLVVIRETQMTSVLVELGFLSNYQEESIIATSEFRENMAKGMFQAILRYWQKDTPEKAKEQTTNP